ncbi:MAG: HutP family protein [Bacillota bacterium]|jgi:hypothetical protein
MSSTGSKKVASAAIKMALSESRDEEKVLKRIFLEEKIHTAAVDYGGEFLSSVSKVIERAVVAAKREGVIKDTHPDEGAVAGATHEALSQIMTKGLGLNIGGKIGIARHKDHVSVAVFFGIGMIHLDEVAVSVAHRAVP